MNTDTAGTESGYDLNGGSAGRSGDDPMTGCPGLGPQVGPDEQLIRDYGLMLSASTRLERIVGKEFERHVGITHAMYEVLRRLEGGCTSMSHLAGETILTSGGMTRLIDRMEKAGLVSRYASDTDRRVQKASLTDKGRATLDHANRVHTQTLRRVFAGALDEDQRESLKHILVRLERVGRAELPSLG
ncbi:MarR family winged helix-turn-helix transcriptional regulator [Actinocorallia longicatena]|uniref:MarR family winged helix-turn-helix transcriptional regulator n=1 Tax=Actinocorallia longicatena TaxID=111803 RepID=UPI0031D94DFF